MPALQSTTPSDLFVILERAFRRRSRGCKACEFSLPYALPGADTWSVEPAKSCSSVCRQILEDLVDEYRGSYCLTPPSGFRAH